MKSLKYVLIPAVVALLACACANNSTVTTNSNQPQVAQSAPSAATPTDELASARGNFKQHCAKCHGEKGLGGVVEMEGHKLKVPNLTQGHALGHTDEKFIKQITEGDEEMPAFKDKLKPGEIKDLVRFIRKEFQGKQ